VKCRVCGLVQEHHTTETEDDAKNFVYNWYDNTYTSLSRLACEKCHLVWNLKLEQFWENQLNESIDLNDDYEFSLPQFESPAEELFWETWKKIFPRIALRSQH